MNNNVFIFSKDPYVFYMREVLIKALLELSLVNVDRLSDLREDKQFLTHVSRITDAYFNSFYRELGTVEAEQFQRRIYHLLLSYDIDLDYRIDDETDLGGMFVDLVYELLDDMVTSYLPIPEEYKYAIPEDITVSSVVSPNTVVIRYKETVEDDVTVNLLRQELAKKTYILNRLAEKYGKLIIEFENEYLENL